MLRKFAITLFFCLAVVCQSAFAQTQAPLSKQQQQKNSETEVKFPSLKKQADEMIKAFETNDFDKFADFIYPKVVEAVGGKDKFVAGLKAATEQFKTSGVEPLDYVVKNPTQIVDYNKRLYSILPTEATLKVQNRTAKVFGGLLGVSDDKGDNWKFVRIESRESLKRLFPDVADGLILPAIEIK